MVVSQIKKTNYTAELNAQQLAVVQAEPGPALVLAGAGSGKTRTLIYRLAWLLERGYKRNKILLLTFTNKAAHEMLERAEQLLGKGDGKDKIWGGTFHHTANRLLRKYGKSIGLKSNFTILDSEDSQSLIKAAIKELTQGLTKARKPGAGIVKEVISFSSNSGLDIEQAVEVKYPEWLKDINYFEAVASLYKKKKQASQAVDFDDLLLNWLKLLQREDWRQVIARNWDYILVDEYQDTNIIQDQIVRLLAKDHQNVLVVGDDAQSIYSFRAANIKNILDFPRNFPGAKIFRLEQNYRSTPEILEVANQVIEKNKQQFQKTLFTRQNSFKKPEIMVAPDAASEAAWIADKIMSLEQTDIALSNIAVLFRAAHLSQELELELNRRSIPYEMRGGLKFFERSHIKDVLAYLKLTANFSDEAAWRRVLLLQAGIGEASTQQIMESVKQLADPAGLSQVKLDLSVNASRSFRELLKIFQQLRSETASTGQLARLVNKFYKDYLQAAYPNYRERWEDIEQLAIYADSFDDLHGFLAQTSLQENYALRGREDKKEPGVILSTVHQAKGLEWHTVFIMQASDKSFPHPLALKEPNGVEEERRLFYVAITRAKKELYISYPVSSSSYSLSLNQPSDFLYDINPEALAGQKMSDEATQAWDDDDVQYLPEV